MSLDTKRYVASERIHPLAQRWYDLAVDRCLPKDDDHKFWWAWDEETQDFLPVNKPCDTCGRDCSHVFTCVECSVSAVLDWEFGSTVQATNRLLCDALAGKKTVNLFVQRTKKNSGWN